MQTFDPLVEARERCRRLSAEAGAKRLVGPQAARHSLADALRRVADRLDPAVVIHVPKPQ